MWLQDSMYRIKSFDGKIDYMIVYLDQVRMNGKMWLHEHIFRITSELAVYNWLTWTVYMQFCATLNLSQ